MQPLADPSCQLPRKISPVRALEALQRQKDFDEHT
jgi:hypothetical protein